ncbi:MAG: DNA mismatch repair endonuclease MutL [Chloroflexi bacterium]|nr:DNA mismatch repair endonuclease MutL [Chloroflexota bacterium]
MPIRILPPDVADKIAAGEVVERPASVVKELVENALDAGAQTIRVEIREGGIRFIRVQDDGSGIPAAEVPLAIRRHATSKIARAEDLEAISTLGFRGEALASIASVSRLTLATRHRDEPVGTRIVVEGGHVQGQESVGLPAGTTVTVEHLFFNVPARRKFLKTPRTEAGYVHRVMTRYALAYPDVRFTYVSDGRTVFQTTGNGRLADVLAVIFGRETAEQMVPVGHVDMPWPEPGPTPAVWGYVGKPSLHRGNRQHIFLFLNRRWIQDHALTQAIIQAYHTFLPVGRYPVAVIHVALDPHLVDVNVHPAKAEVRFREPRVVFAAVQKAVRETIATIQPIRQAHAEVDWTRPPGWADRRRTLVEAGHGQQAFPMPEGEPSLGTSPPPSPPPSDTPVSAPIQLPKAGLVPLLRVIGQVGATYIVAEGPDGLYLIDQHAAHERVLYEKMMAERAARGQVASQQLLDPIPVTMDSELAGLIREHLEELQRAGFEIEPFGGNTYLVRAIPAVFSGQDPKRVVEDVVRGLAEEKDVTQQTFEERLVTMICKRAAVKGGQVLSEEEMRALVRDLEACETPHTCPHGRPTMIHIHAEELAKLFGRLG